MFRTKTNQGLACYHFDFRFSISILFGFGHAPSTNHSSSLFDGHGLFVPKYGLYRRKGFILVEGERRTGIGGYARVPRV